MCEARRKIALTTGPGSDGEEGVGDACPSVDEILKPVSSHTTCVGSVGPNRYHGETKCLLSICMRDSAVAEEVAEAEFGCRLGDFLVLTRMATVTELYIAL